MSCPVTGTLLSGPQEAHNRVSSTSSPHACSAFGLSEMTRARFSDASSPAADAQAAPHTVIKSIGNSLNYAIATSRAPIYGTAATRSALSVIAAPVEKTTKEDLAKPYSGVYAEDPRYVMSSTITPQ